RAGGKSAGGRRTFVRDLGESLPRTGLSFGISFLGRREGGGRGLAGDLFKSDPKSRGLSGRGEVLDLDLPHRLQRGSYAPAGAETAPEGILGRLSSQVQ